MKTLSTEVKVKQGDPTVRPVYDLVNVGKKNRFWANGKLIHNSGGLNVQNLSSGRKAGQSNALKRSITAPDGYVCVAFDSSQVECLDGQGLVLTDKGLKRMLDVSIDDKVWDGVEFVSHLGLVSRGFKRVIEYEGIVGTPDHVVYLADGGHCTLDEAKARQLPLLIGDREGQTVYQSTCTEVRVEELGHTDTTEWGNQYCGTIEVYDLVEAGSRNRFCYNGVIVSNCRVLPYIASDLEYLQVFIDGKDPYSVMASKIYGGDPDDIKRKAKDEIPPYSTIQRPAGKAAVLGCGYGTGWAKFKDFAKQMGVVLTDEESQQIVLTFRQTHDAIVSFWKYCDTVFHRMIAGDSGYFGGLDGKLFYYDGARRLHGQTVPSIRLPDGNWLHYTDLCYRDKEMPDGSVKRNFAYRGMKEGRVQWIFTYGARCTENLTQSLAYSVLKYQAALINKRYPIAGNTHDEWFIVVKEDEAEEAKKYMEWCMKQVPTWAKGLPLDCEGTYAKHYGDC